MHRIDSPNAEADKFGSGKDGFTEGTPGSVLPTETTDDWLDGVQEELCNVIENADITLVKNTRDQLHDALNIMINRANLLGRWPSIYNPKAFGLHAIMYDAYSGYWFAVGALDGTDAYMLRSLSPAGEWTEMSNSKNANLYGIASNGTGTLAAVGSFDGVDTYIVSSTNNGDTWTERTGPNAALLWGLVYANSLFVGVGELSGAPAISTSPDGTTWTARTAPGTERLYAIAYSPTLNLFCAVGEDGADLGIMTSSDGITWTERANSIGGADALSLCWSEFLGLFVLVGYDTGTYPLVATSPDGINWTQRTDANGLLDTSHLYSVCSIESAKLLIAFGYGGNEENSVDAYFSTDGITWTFRPIVGTDPATGCMYQMRDVAEDQDTGLVIACGERPSASGQATLLRPAATNLAVENM
jgi:hypothetical protein